MYLERLVCTWKQEALCVFVNGLHEGFLFSSKCPLYIYIIYKVTIMPIMHLEMEGTDRKVLHNKNKTGSFDYIYLWRLMKFNA